VTCASKCENKVRDPKYRTWHGMRSPGTCKITQNSLETMNYLKICEYALGNVNYLGNCEEKSG
jgi:hypothetical protein